jgi:lysophospholipase L1-like esterase
MKTVSKSLASPGRGIVAHRANPIALVIVLVVTFLLTDTIANAQTFRLAVLGSSTAAGVGANPIDSSWVNKFARYLQDTVPPSEVDDLAIGGYTTFNVMPTGYIPPSPWNVWYLEPDDSHNITYALSLNPSVIIVNLPSNDCVLHVPVEQQIANYDRLVQEADAHGVPIWIASSQPRTSADEEGRDLLKRMRDIIMSAYAPRSIDFWAGLARSDGTIISEYDYDGIHLNNAGHGILFARVKDAINIPPLPIELVSFEAVAKNNDVELIWTTLLEVNNYGFLVLRNGAEIGFVEGGGTATQPRQYRFVDAYVPYGSYTYSLRQIDLDGTAHLLALVARTQVGPSTKVSPTSDNGLAGFTLEQNYPNPFNPRTTIVFETPKSSEVTLSVYDILGREVSVLVNERMGAGVHEATFDASGLATGVYLYRLQAGEIMQTKKLMVLN